MHSPRAQALLRSGRKSNVPRPTMAHQGDRHHSRPRGCPTRGNRGPHHPRTRSSGASSSRETKPRPAPRPKSPRGGRVTTCNWPLSACPSGSGASGCPRGPCPGYWPSPPPTHKSRRALTRGRTLPPGHNTPSPAGTTPSTGSSAAWTLAHPYSTLRGPMPRPCGAPRCTPARPHAAPLRSPTLRPYSAPHYYAPARPHATPMRGPALRPCAAPHCCAPATPHTAAPLRGPTLRPYSAPRCARAQPHAAAILHGPMPRPGAAPRCCAPAQPHAAAPLRSPAPRPHAASSHQRPRGPSNTHAHL